MKPDGTASDQAPNAAARMGRWSAQHRKTAIWGWLVFVIVAFVAGNAVGLRTADQAHLGVGESGRADLTVDNGFPKNADELVLVQSTGATADSLGFRAAVGDAMYRLSQLPYVYAIESPYDPANQSQISGDGRSALIRFKIAGDESTAKSRASSTLRAVDETQAAHPDFTIGEFGDASSNNQVSASISNDFKTALVTSLPVTLLILLVAFGALVAAGVPLLLGLTAVIGTIGLLGPLSHIGNGVDESINEVVLLIGLAVGVDYSMFYLRREREEREAGRSEGASLAAAAATSGRAVMVSGFTVMIAMAGMYLAGAPTFQSFATGTILVVAVAVVGSLTVLPATLAWLGDRVEKGRIPFLSKRSWNSESRVWSRILNPALRHPVISVLLAGGLLVFLAIPAFGLHTATPGVDTLPQDLGVIKTYNRIQTAFPGGPIPAEVVVQADDVKSLEVGRAINDLSDRASASPNFKQPITTTTNSDHTVEVVDIPVAGDGTDAQSTAALAELRDKLIPATIGRVPGATADVTGYTASSTDFNDAMKSHAPIVFVFVLSAAFLLLLFTFRSVVIPVTAIILNLLSVGAAYGVMVWIFQEGHLESVLGFKSNGSIVSWMPLFMFVVLFGLSMDYHVFILTRIREAFDRGRPTEEAVSHGIKTTAGVVTSAAVVMISVFAIFATLSLLIFKELGIGLAVAVLIDATIIRGVLLPATMKLLGDWNWYLPKWLEWLPKVGPGRGAPPTAEGPDVAAPGAQRPPIRT